MAVARVGTPQTAVSGPSTASSHTVSHTTHADTNILEVEISLLHYSTLANISSVTFNGVAMTAVPGAASSSGSLEANSKLASYYLVNPGAGITGDVVATFSSTGTYMRGMTIVNYSGADTTTPVEGGNVGTGTGTSMSIGPTTTTAADDMLAGVLAASVVSSSLTNITPLDTENGEWYGNFADIITNAQESLSAGSGNTLDWTNSTSKAWHAVAFVIKAAAGGSTFVAPKPVTKLQAVKRASYY